MIELLAGVGLILAVLWHSYVWFAWQRERRNPLQQALWMQRLDKTDERIRDEFVRARMEQQQRDSQQREELSHTLLRQQQLLTMQLSEQAQRIDRLLEDVRTTIQQRLAALQADNGQKLEEMRRTVDEKLHATLERRLGESFQLVGERLELVHKGLGEMQQLAVGVGDLKRVLSNVKTRGTMGEVQLQSLLEQTLTAEQFERFVPIGKRQEKVDFGIKLPERLADDRHVIVPIDAKFPLEEYERLLEAQEVGDVALANLAFKKLELTVKNEAKSIRTKYIAPPHTTDFALLYVPIEGLYAELLRRPGLWDTLQREYRVIVTGPTTLLALLNSLQLGFRSLAIQKHTQDVWDVLRAVKTEFSKFGEMIEKTQKKLHEATSTLDTASTRTRAITRQLMRAEEQPAHVERPRFIEE